LKRRVKHILTAGVALSLIVAQATPVSADTASDLSDAQAQKEATSAEYEALQSSISDLESQKQGVLGQVDSLEEQLIVSIASIQSLDTRIQEQGVKLQQTGEQLAQAQEDQEVQYDAMKARITYLYENGGDNGWASMLLSDENLSDVLDRAQSTQQLYDYDRDQLQLYMDSVQQVTDLQAQQLNEQSQLETMKSEQVANQQNLETLKAEAMAQYDDYEARIASAEASASEYLALIEQQNAQISQLQEQQAAEQAAAEQAAAEQAAAEQAAAEQAAAQTASAAASVPTYEDNSYSEPVYEETYDDGGSSYEEPAASSNSAPAPSDTSGTAQAVANYACSFIGVIPYIWGGTSLTTGADCSGFVQACYRAFGYSISRTTYTQMYDGIGVSYSEAQPGDLILYDGHVGMYIGGGQMVNAASPSEGIRITNCSYAPIIAVRRIIY